jgi:hypothetical protein
MKGYYPMSNLQVGDRLVRVHDKNGLRENFDEFITITAFDEKDRAKVVWDGTRRTKQQRRTLSRAKIISDFSSEKKVAHQAQKVYSYTEYKDMFRLRVWAAFSRPTLLDRNSELHRLREEYHSYPIRNRKGWNKFLENLGVSEADIGSFKNYLS